MLFRINPSLFFNCQPSSPYIVLGVRDAHDNTLVRRQLRLPLLNLSPSVVPRAFLCHTDFDTSLQKGARRKLVADARVRLFLPLTVYCQHAPTAGCNDSNSLYSVRSLLALCSYYLHLHPSWPFRQCIYSCWNSLRRGWYSAHPATLPSLGPPPSPRIFRLPSPSDSH